MIPGNKLNESHILNTGGFEYKFDSQVSGDKAEFSFCLICGAAIMKSAEVLGSLTSQSLYDWLSITPSWGEV